MRATCSQSKMTQALKASKQKCSTAAGSDTHTHTLSSASVSVARGLRVRVRAYFFGSSMIVAAVNVV